MTEAMSFTFVEMNKFTKKIGELGGTEDSFYYCIRNMQHLSEKPETLTDPVFDRLFEESELAAMDFEEQRSYMRTMTKYERNTINQIEYAQEIAAKEAANEARLATAKAMKSKGYPISDIIDCTGLSRDSISSL